MMNTRYGENENLTLTDDDLSVNGAPKPQAGGEKVRAFCPVHGGDQQRSLEVDMKTGRFFCHNCRCWGYMDWAREEFAREKGLEKETVTRRATTRRVTRKTPPPPPKPIEPVRDDLDELLANYQEALPGSWGEKYLQHRNVPLDLAKQYGIGYASSKGWFGRGWKGGRLVIPHHRPDGLLVNLYGRAVAIGKVPQESKHDHLSGNKGWFNARVLHEGEGPLFICEAGLDALALIASGYDRTIAIYGTHGWRWHWVPKNIRQIVIAADADEGGDTVRETIGKEARYRGIEVAYLDKANYGGEKDAAAAYVAGVLTVGEFPASTRTPQKSIGNMEHWDYQAEADAALDRARREIESIPVTPADTLPPTNVITLGMHSSEELVESIVELPDDDAERISIKSATDLVVFLVKRGSHDWAGYFENLCRIPESLRISGGREFYWQSKKMGWDWTREEIQDALFAVAGALYPESPAGQPHAHYDDLYWAAVSYLDEHDLRHLLTDDQDTEHIDGAVQAMAANDRAGYRRALRGWIEAARGVARD